MHSRLSLVSSILASRRILGSQERLLLKRQFIGASINPDMVF